MQEGQATTVALRDAIRTRGRLLALRAQWRRAGSADKAARACRLALARDPRAPSPTRQAVIRATEPADLDPLVLCADEAVRVAKGADADRRGQAWRQWSTAIMRAEPRKV